MNQLKKWGFSEQWWRGERGEYWVLAQTILSIGFILLPVYPAVILDNLPPIWQYLRWGLMGVCGLISIVFFLTGSVELGTNLTPLPHPKTDGNLDWAYWTSLRKPSFSISALRNSCRRY